jgi:cytochrome o ubiquinol oxidase operon protein cyoD
MSPSEFRQSFNKYLTGFVIALLLSVASYLVVAWHLISSGGAVMLVIFGLAVVQFGVQLVCFLHIGFNKRSQSKSGALLFTLMMMLVIVIGSLWIMKNLDYRMGMSANSMNEYMREQNKKGF